MNSKTNSNPVSSFGNRPIFNDDYGNNIIADKVKIGEPFCFGRIGMSEMMVLYNHLRGNSWDTPVLTPTVSVRHQARFMGGLYPPTDGMLNRFCEYYLSRIKEVDMYGTWVQSAGYGHLGESALCQDYVNPSAVLTTMNPPISFDRENPWTLELKGKTLLVAHPFSESIESQAKNLKNIWSGKAVFPDDVKIKTLKVPLYDYLIEPEFPDWFSALEDMKRKMENTQFDVLIVGAGFWGVPLALHAKKIGKIGLHTAGATQLLFGIRGKRWDGNKQYQEQFFNEHWVRPLPKETPAPKFEEYKEFFHEGGCYW